MAPALLRTATLLLAVSVSAAALAQVPPAQIGARHVPAPWWMLEPVIASIGEVRTELTANRAQFGAQFQSVERTAAEATAAAARKVRDIDAAIRALGADKARLETTFATRPLYEQYRDKDGRILENQRPDQVERYEVSANLRIEVRDLAVLERVYSAVQDARPTSTSAVSFRLEPDNEAKTWLFTEAVKDAARRARLAASAAGAQLGGVKVIDPTGRACETDVLAGWPSYGGGTLPTDVDYAARPAMAPPAPPPPPAPARARGGAVDESVQITLQPPRQWLNADACVVYGLRT
jgi:hypothetical protein